MSETPSHETIIINRSVKASIEQVFAAFEDPKARAQWGPPSDDEAIEFIENDFREGSGDIHLCGEKGNLQYRVETRYYAINRPSRLIFTERISKADALLGTSLNSLSLSGNTSRTELVLTIQFTSVVGSEFISAVRSGWEIALDNLAAGLTHQGNNDAQAI